MMPAGRALSVETRIGCRFKPFGRKKVYNGRVILYSWIPGPRVNFFCLASLRSEDAGLASYCGLPLHNSQDRRVDTRKKRKEEKKEIHALERRRRQLFSLPVSLLIPALRGLSQIEGTGVRKKKGSDLFLEQIPL